MNRQVKFALCSLLLVSIGVCLGYFLNIPGPASGGGRSEQSPDAKLLASAESLDDSTLLGIHRTYYQFTIETAPPATHAIRRVRIEDTSSPLINWREDGSIVWSSNNSAVTFLSSTNNPNFAMTLNINP